MPPREPHPLVVRRPRRKPTLKPKRQPRSTAFQPLGKQGPALQTQVRQAHRKVRRAEAKLPGRSVPVKRFPHLKTYTPAQRHTILREQTRAITHEVAKARRQGGEPAAARRMQEIHAAANLGEKVTRQALHQYEGAQQAQQKRHDVTLGRLLAPNMPDAHLLTPGQRSFLPRTRAGKQPTDREMRDAYAVSGKDARSAIGTNAGRYRGTTYRVEHSPGFADTMGIGKLPVVGKGLNTTGKVLDFVARPLHATAGAALALQTHGSVTEALSRGIKGQSRTTYSDVLGAGGVKGPAKYIGGFAGDVGLDPLNLMTLGVGTPVKVLEESAAAARRGAEAARTAGQAAKAERLIARAEALERQIPTAATNKGLRVGLRTPVGSRGRSMDLPLVTKATAGLSKISGLSAGATHLREGESLPARATQALGKVFAPDMRPPGVNEAEWRKTLDAEREARAADRIGVRRAERRGKAYAGALKGQDDAEVLRAMERSPVDVGESNAIRDRIRKLEAEVEKHRGAVTRAHERWDKARAGYDDAGVARAGREALAATQRAHEAEGALRAARKELSGSQRAVFNVTKPPPVLKRIGTKVIEKAGRAYKFLYRPAAKDINAKTWYHGTNVEGLSHEDLAGTGTDVANLFGQGIYLTDDARIAGTYAAARARRGGGEHIYQAKIHVRNPLDMEAPVNKGFWSALAKTGRSIGHLGGNLREPNLFISEEVAKAAARDGATNDNLYRSFVEAVQEYATDYGLSKGDLTEYFQDLASDLRARGFDALTHVGGRRVGDSEHQVVVLLDPENAGALAKAERQAQSFTPHTPPQPAKLTVGRYSSTTPPPRITAEGIRPGAPGVARHAVENLPEPLRTIAQRAQAELGDVASSEQAAGLLGATRADYAPHQWAESLGERARARVPGQGSSLRNQYATHRKLEGSIDEINARSAADGVGPLFSTDLPALMASRLGKSAKLKAERGFQQRLANEQVARTIEHGGVSHYLETHPQDTLYTMGKDGIKALEDNKGLPDIKAAEQAIKGGQPVFGMNRLIGQRYTKGFSKINTTEGPSVGRGFDRFTSGMKTLFTVFNIPAYDLRNLTGDLFNAYLANTTSKDILDGFRAMAVQAKRHGAELTLDKQFTSKATVSLGRGERISMEEALKRAEASGAIQTGYVGAEKFEVVRGTEDTGIRTVFNRPQPIEKLRGISQVREDGVRLGTWLGAKRRGLSDSEAARWANSHHFDYADLTDAERAVMRRVFPFYTFVARNTRLQATKLLTNPGKYANYQALREESSKHAGLGPEWESHLAPYQQRAGGIPFSLPGEKGARMAYPALPLTDLSRLAAFASGDTAASFDLAAQNVNPLIKSPVEYLMNHSTFFRAPIYRDENNPDARKWVPAPPVIASNPALRQALGLKQIPDPNNKNKPTWMWSAKTDFWARQTPQTNFALQALTPATGSHGQTSKMALASQLSGVKFGNYDRVKVELTEAQKHMRELRVKQNDMGDEGTDRSGPDKGHYSHAYRKLLDEINATQKRIDRLKKKQGKAGKKPRVSSGKGGGGGGSYGAPAGGGGSYGAPSGGGGTYGL